MTERAKILVAYDGSENAEAALEDLKREGWGPEAEILVMTVADVFLPPPINEELDDTFPMYVPEGVKLALARTPGVRVVFLWARGELVG